MKSLRLSPVFISTLVTMPFLLYKIIIIDAWTSFSVFFIILSIIVAIIVLSIDRIMILNLPKIFVWVSEIIIIIFFYVIYALSNATFCYNVENDVEWFVVVDNKKQNRKISYSFPFDESLKVENKEFISTAITKMKRKKILIKKDNAEISYSSQQKINSNGVNYVVFKICPYEFSKEDEDLINEEIGKINAIH